jgi:TetR/AcrR family transcriptional repressor of nem operon
VGFEGLRLRQVAEDIGIDHSTLHHHFATKQALVQAVAEYATRQFWDLGDLPDDPVEALRAHLTGLHRMVEEWPELFAVTAELDLRGRRDGAVATAMAGHQAGWREVLGGVLAAGNDRGSWSVDAAAATELVIAVVKGVRLEPDLAGPVFTQLIEMVVGER